MLVTYKAVVVKVNAPLSTSERFVVTSGFSTPTCSTTQSVSVQCFLFRLEDCEHVLCVSVILQFVVCINLCFCEKR